MTFIIKNHIIRRLKNSSMKNEEKGKIIFPENLPLDISEWEENQSRNIKESIPEIQMIKRPDKRIYAHIY